MSNKDWLKELQTYIFLIGHDLDKWDMYLPLMSRKNIEEVCKKVRDGGYNAISTSVAHYRWDFIEHTDRISQFLSDLCEIGNKYGLKIWEHHSVTMRRKLMGDYKYKRWQLGNMVKIDFRTGDPYYMHVFGGVVFCSSNPYFKEAYFDLAKKFALNDIDIYMPDDMGAANSYYD